MNKIIAIQYEPPFTDFLSKDLKSQSDAFNGNVIKHETGKFITKLVIADILGINWCDINLVRNAYGKPLLVDQWSCALDFSLSYTGNWIFLAVSTETNVGVDAEFIEPVNVDTASEFCLERELEMVKSDPDKNLENYYKLWTLKESFLKVIGMGLSYPIKNIEFVFNKDGVKCYNKNKIVSDYFFKIYKLKNILISLCMKNQNFPEKIEVYNPLDSLTESFNKNQHQNVKNYAKAAT